jgi:hypothetical protein
MSNPLRFETLNRKLNFEAGTIEKLSLNDGFPLAGDGVARFEDVQAWIEKTTSPDGTAEETSAASKAASESVAEPVVASGDAGDVAGESVECVVIRIPVSRKGSSLPGTNPVQTMRLASSERHIRDAWGKVLHGCRLANVTMANGKPVKTVADCLKYVLEQVAIEID